MTLLDSDQGESNMEVDKLAPSRPRSSQANRVERSFLKASSEMTRPKSEHKKAHKLGSVLDSVVEWETKQMDSGYDSSSSNGSGHMPFSSHHGMRSQQMNDDTIAEDDDEEDVSKSEEIARSLKKTRDQLALGDRRALFSHKFDKDSSRRSESNKLGMMDYGHEELKIDPKRKIRNLHVLSTPPASLKAHIGNDDVPPKKIRGVVSEIHHKSSNKDLKQMQYRADKLSAKLKRSVESDDDEGDNVEEEFSRDLFRHRRGPLKRASSDRGPSKASVTAIMPPEEPAMKADSPDDSNGSPPAQDAAGITEFTSYLENRAKQSHADMKSDSKSISDEADMSRSRTCGEETTSAAAGKLSDSRSRPAGGKNSYLDPFAHTPNSDSRPRSDSLGPANRPLDNKNPLHTPYQSIPSAANISPTSATGGGAGSSIPASPIVPGHMASASPMAASSITANPMAGANSAAAVNSAATVNPAGVNAFVANPTAAAAAAAANIAAVGSNVGDLGAQSQPVVGMSDFDNRAVLQQFLLNQSNQGLSHESLLAAQQPQDNSQMLNAYNTQLLTAAINGNALASAPNVITPMFQAQQQQAQQQQAQQQFSPFLSSQLVNGGQTIILPSQQFNLLQTGAALQGLMPQVHGPQSPMINLLWANANPTPTTTQGLH